MNIQYITQQTYANTKIPTVSNPADYNPPSFKTDKDLGAIGIFLLFLLIFLIYLIKK